MKTLFLVAVFTLVNLFTYSQLTINAGGNKHVCPHENYSANGYPPISIGGTPTAMGGTPPYIYTWYITPIVFIPNSSFPYLYAHNFLNDTTLANPTIQSFSNLPDSTIFYITVTDSLGSVSTSSCVITISSFGIHLANWVYEINLGDSAYHNQAPNISGNSINMSWSGALSYTWRPSHGLRDSTLAMGFWSKPEHSIGYTAYVTDSKGCKKAGGVPTYYVCVKGSTVATEGIPNGGMNYCFSTGVKENPANQINLSVYPNPVDEILNVECEMTNENLSISIIDIYGREIKNEKLEIKNGTAEINVSELKSGIYFVKAETDNRLSVMRKFVKE